MGIVNVFSTYLPPTRALEKWQRWCFPACRRNGESPSTGLLTSDEIHSVIIKGNTKKAAERDGIGLNLFQATWNTIKDDRLELFSQMLVPRNLKENKTWDSRAYP